MTKQRVLLSLLAVTFFICARPLSASDFPTYYPSEFHDDLQSPRGQDEEIKSVLFKILSSSHLKQSGSFDKLVASCSGAGASQCYQQVSLSYETARKHLFGQLHLEQSAQGHSIQEVYCHKTITRGVGPMRIPAATDVNCEHTWPQSKFTARFSKNTQKGDLHHLYPSDDVANSTRGNHPFGEVNGEALQDCEDSSIGSIKGELHFEPPADHKGNVARALFYFSVRYQMPIDPIQEGFLKKWHREDPVDAAEEARNNSIFEIQGNRNPFIDFPQLAESIRDF